jgi:hypothetical protein
MILKILNSALVKSGRDRFLTMRASLLNIKLSVTL